MSVLKGWSDQKVNTQFGKISTHKLQDENFTARYYITNKPQLQYNLEKNIWGKTKVRATFIPRNA